MSEVEGAQRFDRVVAILVQLQSKRIVTAVLRVNDRDWLALKIKYYCTPQTCKDKIARFVKQNTGFASKATQSQR